MNNQIIKISKTGCIIWGLAALFYLYEFFLRTYISSLASNIITDLKLNVMQFTLIGSAYYLSYSLMQVPVGIIIDKIGVKIMMTCAIVLCACSAFLMGWSHGFYEILASRLLMGFGSSFAFVCLLVIVATWFPPRLFGLFSGISQFIGTVGPLLAGGPFIALILALHESWRVASWQIGIAGLILAGATLLLVRNNSRDNTQALIILKHNKKDKVSLAKLWRNAQAKWIAFYSGMVYVPLALLGAIWGVEYLKVCGFSQTTAGFIISMMWLAHGISCPLLGIASDVFHQRKGTLVFCSLLGLISVVYIIFFISSRQIWLSYLAFSGLGISASGQSMAFAVMSEHVDKELRATAIGLNNAAVTSAGTLFPIIISHFIQHHTTQAHAYSYADFKTGFIAMPILFIIASYVAIVKIKETFGKPQKETIYLQPV